jgi:hypothetical protein
MTGTQRNKRCAVKADIHLGDGVSCLTLGDPLAEVCASELVLAIARGGQDDGRLVGVVVFGEWIDEQVVLAARLPRERGQSFYLD